MKDLSKQKEERLHYCTKKEENYDFSSFSFSASFFLLK